VACTAISACLYTSKPSWPSSGYTQSAEKACPGLPWPHRFNYALHLDGFPDVLYCPCHPSTVYNRIKNLTLTSCSWLEPLPIYHPQKIACLHYTPHLIHAPCPQSSRLKKPFSSVQVSLVDFLETTIMAGLPLLCCLNSRKEQHWHNK